MKELQNTISKIEEYKCTNCGGDATIAYAPETISRGKHKGEERDSWGGLVKAGERICLVCGKKRGISFSCCFVRRG